MVFLIMLQHCFSAAINVDKTMAVFFFLANLSWRLIGELIGFFVLIGKELWLLWQLMATYSCHWLILWKKWKLAFTVISLQIFWQNFYRNVPWVVLYQTYLFYCNLLIWLVTMATKRQIQLLRSCVWDKTKTLQLCF